MNEIIKQLEDLIPLFSDKGRAQGTGLVQKLKENISHMKLNSEGECLCNTFLWRHDRGKCPLNSRIA